MTEATLRPQCDGIALSPRTCVKTAALIFLALLALSPFSASAGQAGLLPDISVPAQYHPRISDTIVSFEVEYPSMQPCTTGAVYVSSCLDVHVEHRTPHSLRETIAEQYRLVERARGKRRTAVRHTTVGSADYYVFDNDGALESWEIRSWPNGDTIAVQDPGPFSVRIRAYREFSSLSVLYTFDKKLKTDAARIDANVTATIEKFRKRTR